MRLAQIDRSPSSCIPLQLPSERPSFLNMGDSWLRGNPPFSFALLFFHRLLSRALCLRCPFPPSLSPFPPLSPLRDASERRAPVGCSSLHEPLPTEGDQFARCGTTTARAEQRGEEKERRESKAQPVGAHSGGKQASPTTTKGAAVDYAMLRGRSLTQRSAPLLPHLSRFQALTHRESGRHKQ